MAGGSFELTRTGSTSSYITFKCTWSSTPNVSANTSTVKVTITASKSSSSTADTYGNYTAGVSITSGGSQSVGSTSFRLAPGKTITLFNKTFTVPHNSDGSKTVTITAEVGGNVMYGNGSQTAALDKINRTPGNVASFTITAGDGDYVALGETITLKWSAASGTVTRYELQYSRGNSGWKEWKSVGGTSTTDSFTSTDINTNGAGKAVKYRVRAVNGSYPSAWKESNTLYISGGVDIKVNGSWKVGSVWIKVNGSWKRAKRVYTKASGKWMQSK